MGVLVTLLERARMLEAENERLRAKNERLRADLDFVAIMADVDIDDGEEPEEDSDERI